MAAASETLRYRSPLCLKARVASMICAPVRSKMIYSGSKEMIKRVLVGTHLHINATSIDELFETEVSHKFKEAYGLDQ